MPPILVVALLPLLITCAIVGFRRPIDLLLPAYAASVPFGSLLSTGLPPPLDSVSTPLGLLLTAALAARLLTRRAAQVRFPMTVSIWLLFLGVTGATSLWSVSPQLTELAFRNLAILVVLYVLLFLTPVDLAALRRTESALLLGALAAAAYGVYQFATGTLPVGDEDGGGGRFGRDLLGANNTAAALVVPFAIALCRSSTWTTLRGRVAYAAAGGLLVFSILLTGSRGGLLATAACFIVAIISIKQGRRFLLRYASAAVVVVVVILLIQPGGVAGRADSTNSSGRTEIWKVGLSACQTYCLQGSGWGTFPVVYRLELPRVADARVLGRGVAYEPHNILIQIGIEAGIVGLVLALLGLSFTLRDTYRLPAFLRGPPLSGFAAMLVAAFFLSNFEYKFFWMALMYMLMCRSVWLGMDAAPKENVIQAGDSIVIGRSTEARSSIRHEQDSEVEGE